MKTTIDIPDQVLAEAMRHTGASTKREAVVTAIVDFNRRRRLAKLAERFAGFDGFLSHDDLRRSRSDA
jgi:Arc/MetJ family transcription regulator